MKILAGCMYIAGIVEIEQHSRCMLRKADVCAEYTRICSKATHICARIGKAIMSNGLTMSSREKRAHNSVFPKEDQVRNCVARMGTRNTGGLRLAIDEALQTGLEPCKLPHRNSWA